jgi:hypothetical protein
MYERKINFVCTVCSQRFTRKSGAKRHSNTIHAGTASFVSLIDYIVGRIEGRYQPSDPWSYRKKKPLEKNVKNIPSLENWKNSTSGNKIPASQFTTFADETIKNQYYGIGVTEINSAMPEKGGEPSPSYVQRNDEGLYGIERRKQDGDNLLVLELQEFFDLVQKHYDKETAGDIIARVKFAYSIGRAHAVEFDKWLPFLRGLDKQLSSPLNLDPNTYNII